MSEHICAEIIYETTGGPVHSDICGTLDDPSWRKFLHDNLDEWLNRSDGTGVFYVGEPGLWTREVDS